jgi:hypothetical protein
MPPATSLTTLLTEHFLRFWRKKEQEQRKEKGEGFIPLRGQLLRGGVE